MHKQESFDFAQTRPTDAAARARKHGAETSREAAEEINASGKASRQASAVHAALWRLNHNHDRPTQPTSAELAEVMGVDRYMTARRLPDLAAIDPPLAQRSGKRKCEVTGKNAYTWLALGEPEQKL